MKTKTITLTKIQRADFDGDQRKYVTYSVYRVEQVTNSIDYSPAEELRPQVVEELCKLDDWKVTILAPWKVTIKAPAK
jgi:hypothetical protein